jgi:hypothetical protein
MSSRISNAPKSILLSFVFAALLLFAGGCATCDSRDSAVRQFNPKTDGFSFPNELYWEYGYDTNQVWRAHKRQPPPIYALHCFPMVRAARCFLYHARFDPALPRTTDDSYVSRIREIIGRGSRCPSAPENKVIIPGFHDLFEFSSAYEPLLKANCGSAAQSYLQRGNLRMVFPFTRGNQRHTAEALSTNVKNKRFPIVHLVDFPKQKINHFVLVHDLQERPDGLVFLCYDPNSPSGSMELTFDPLGSRFLLPRNNYFPGGRVNVYEVEKNLWK